MKKWVVSSAAAGAVILCVCAFAFQGGSSSGRFSVLTYNVAGLPEPLSGSRPIRNQPVISALINDYDLVLVQEDFAYHRKLCSKASHNYASKRDSDSTLGDGLARFSIFPFEDLVHIDWEACAGYLRRQSDCMTKKGFSVARHMIAPGVDIHVYNLHMEAGYAPEDSQAKEVDMTQFIDYVLANSSGRAVIITGDFNLKKGRERDSIILARMEDTLDLTDACVAVGGCRDRIDRIFFRSGGGVALSAVEYEVPAEKFRDKKGRPLSDHKPVSAVIEWRLLEE